MRRPWFTWCIYLTCVAVVLSAMAWFSITLLRMDAAEERMIRRAEVEEHVRLAMWRMERTIAPIISQENARPYFMYRPFYRAQGAYTGGKSAIQFGEVLVPSPLLTQTPNHVLVHFQFSPKGELTSPQAPTGTMLAMAKQLIEKGATTPERIQASTQCLTQLGAMLDQEQLASACVGPAVWSNTSALARAATDKNGQLNQLSLIVTPEQLLQELRGDRGSGGKVDPPTRPALGRGRYAPTQQALRNDVERRQMQNAYVASAAVSKAGNQGLLPPAKVREGLMTPVWTGDALLLARSVEIDDNQYLQGCWLDWSAIKSILLEQIADLLPNAQLVPAQGGDSDPSIWASMEPKGHVLASLPITVKPGPLTVSASPTWTPIRASLGVIWACVALAVIAVSWLMWGTLSLSERRASFVSSVTHELRTPLTTLRIYSEMLDAGMIRDESQRAQYIDTLHQEAGRLGHLVENVLSYARLERGQSKSRFETLSLSELLRRMSDRLCLRAEQAGMDLVVDNACLRSTPDQISLRTDPVAVEQIVFNLVDNACKYGVRSAEGGNTSVIRLEADANNKHVMLRVKDDGPGVPRSERGRIFKPFRKSAHAAANSAPGVGLGLALSRRLARRLGGDLTIQSQDGGSCFVLRFPRQD